MKVEIDVDFQRNNVAVKAAKQYHAKSKENSYTENFRIAVIDS